MDWIRRNVLEKPKPADAPEAHEETRRKDRTDFRRRSAISGGDNASDFWVAALIYDDYSCVSEGGAQ